MYAGTSTFVEQLKSNSTLKILDLSGCGLNSPSAESLAGPLSTNTHLEELNISHNAEIGEGGIQRLMRALRFNQGLKKLDLTACKLTAHSAMRLAGALRANRHLEELNISGNALRDGGVQYVACALQVNCHLKRLELASCGITNIGLRYLVMAIQNNHILNALLVHNSLNKTKNSITKAGFPIENLQNNRALTGLYLPLDMDSCKASIQKSINDRRRRRGWPLIKVEGMMLCCKI